MMNTSRKKGRTNRRKRTKNPKRSVRSRNRQLRLTEPGLYAPKSVIVRLTFPDTVIVRTGGASPSTNWSYNATSAYDPDPTFGTGAMPGYAEWSNIYQRYRVHGFQIAGDVCTLDPVPAAVVISPGMVLFGNNTRTNVQIMEQGANPLSKIHTISGSTGGGKVRFNHSWTMNQIMGDNRWLMDPNYTALVTTNPAFMVYLFIGGYTLSGGNWTNGLGTAIRVSMDVEFMDRRVVFT